MIWVYERKSEYGIYPSAVKLPNIEFEMSGKGCRCYYLPPRRNAPGENVDVWCCHILALSARISVAKEMKRLKLKFSIPLTSEGRYPRTEHSVCEPIHFSAPRHFLASIIMPLYLRPFTVTT